MNIKEIETDFQNMKIYEVDGELFKVEKTGDSEFHIYEKEGRDWLHCFVSSSHPNYLYTLKAYLTDNDDGYITEVDHE